MLSEPSEHIVPLGQPQYYSPNTPNGVGVVVIHGFSGSPYQMRDLGKFLCGHGYTIVIPRLPGHASRLEYFARSTGDNWQAAVHASVVNLQGTCSTIVLIGRSFGGVLALRELLAHPTEIHSVICISTPAPLLQQRLQRFALPLLLMFKQRIAKPWAKEEERNERIAQGRYLELPIPAVQEYLNVLCSLRSARLDALAAPMLFIHGEQDDAVSPKSLSWYLRKLPPQSTESLLLKAAAHDAAFLHTNNALQQRIVDFLQKNSNSDLS